MFPDDALEGPDFLFARFTLERPEGEIDRTLPEVLGQGADGSVQLLKGHGARTRALRGERLVHGTEKEKDKEREEDGTHGRDLRSLAFKIAIPVP